MFIREENIIRNNFQPNIDNNTVALDMKAMVTENLKKEKPKTYVDGEPFKEYKNTIAEKEKEQIPSPCVDVNFYNTYANFDNVKRALMDYDKLSDDQFIALFISNFDGIIDSIFKTNDKSLVKIFIEVKSLDMIIRAFNSNAINLTREQIFYCNKIIYDFIVLRDKDESSKFIEQLLVLLAKIINRAVLQEMQILRLPEDLSIKLIVAAYSSQKEIVNIKRLNTYIMDQSFELMSDKMITDIYCILLKNRSMTKIIEGIMFDVWSNDEFEEIEDKIEIYAAINLALLNLLEDLPSKILRAALLNYTNDKKMIYPDNPVRFNLRSFVVEDYPRLDANLKWIDSVDGYQNY